MKTTFNLFLLMFVLCSLYTAKSFAGRDGSLHASWSTTDYHVGKFDCPPASGLLKQQALTGWRGERLHAKLLLWSSADEGELRFSITEPQDAQWADLRSTGFMRYVMTDELNKDGKGGCGYRPDKTKFDSLLVADRIQSVSSLPYEPNTVSPVWITFDVPRDAAPGLYKGKVKVSSTSGKSVSLTYSIRVVDRTLPPADKRQFHLDLWQNPYAVARVAGVPLWSDAHFGAMAPLMERLARAGQRGITATITHKPWNGQTYDYFDNMITEIRRVDGTWTYDYTLFDRWVEFMMSCGVGPYIYCYSVIPWELTFRYYDQAANDMVDRKLQASDPEFDEYWVSKLRAFAAHLKSKGWFEHTIIAMDERPVESMNAALRVIRKADPDFKISLAGHYHKELDEEIYDYCIGYDEQYPAGVVQARRAQGKITTFYTCCTEAYPNTFTFSQPIEASAFGLIAAERELDGYLRWAYNSWTESPAEDSRFTAWAAGDTYLVYPRNGTSARFEKLIEGIQMFEKIQLMKADPHHAQAIDKLLQPFAYDKMNSAELQKNIGDMRKYLNGR